jgi:hypothetical protein
MTGKTTEEVLKEAGGYEGILKSMEQDLNRTQRKREVEACFSGDIEQILRSLHNEAASKSAMLRRINEALASNGYDGSLSRPTIYRWLGDHLEDED